MGLEQMLDLLQVSFYWPGMTKDAELYIMRCDQCIHFKSRPQTAVMQTIQATHPLQLIYFDYCMIKATEGEKDVPMLVIMDHFMWYAQGLVTSLQTDKCIVQALKGSICGPLWPTREHSL